MSRSCICLIISAIQMYFIICLSLTQLPLLLPVLNRITLTRTKNSNWGKFIRNCSRKVYTSLIALTQFVYVSLCIAFLVGNVFKMLTNYQYHLFQLNILLLTLFQIIMPVPRAELNPLTMQFSKILCIYVPNERSLSKKYITFFLVQLT